MATARGHVVVTIRERDPADVHLGCAVGDVLEMAPLLIHHTHQSIPWILTRAQPVRLAAGRSHQQTLPS
ncbi:MAG: hypothetical protein RI568_10215, partial [Natronomonas sp.]|nr:hypothetical protein [Natronomonas sp.]